MAALQFRFRDLILFITLTGAWMAALREWPLATRIVFFWSLMSIGILGGSALDPYPKNRKARILVERSKTHLVVGLRIWLPGLIALAAMSLSHWFVRSMKR